MTSVEYGTDTSFRLQLVAALRGGQAFDSLETILNEVPNERRFTAPFENGKSAWQIVEHMRLSLTDLANYVDNEPRDYRSPIWPDDYWLTTPENITDKTWDESVAALLSARQRVEDLIMDPTRDLLAPFPHHHSHTLLREALLALEHTAYHCGEIVELSMGFR